MTFFFLPFFRCLELLEPDWGLPDPSESDSDASPPVRSVRTDALVVDWFGLEMAAGYLVGSELSGGNSVAAVVCFPFLTSAGARCQIDSADNISKESSEV